MLQSPAGDGTCIPQAARSTIVAKVAFRVRSGCFACGGRDAVIRRCPRPIAPTPGPSPEGEGWRGASTYRGYSSPSPEGEGLGWGLSSSHTPLQRNSKQFLRSHRELHRDRKRVVRGKGVSVRLDLGGRSLIKKKKTK